MTSHSPSPDISRLDLLSIFDIIDECLTAPAVPDFLFRRILDPLKDLMPAEAILIGVASASRIELKDTREVWNFGFDAEWLTIYQNKQYEKIDPVVKGALHQGAAVSWRDIIGTDPGIDPNFVSLKEDFGLRNGITCGYIDRSDFPQATVVTVSMPRNEVAPRFRYILERIVPHLPAACSRAIPALRAERIPQLTGRELEILRWVKEGKSSWAIGEILSISERTVKFHVASIFRKLNVISRPQAVAKALRLRLLDL